MIIITDCNEIISAIYAPKGAVAQIFSSKSKIQFLAPDYILEEVFEHLQDIAEELGLPSHEVRKRLADITKAIIITEVAKIPKKYIVEAVEIAKDIDPEDAPYIALHLYKKHKIWTSDKVLINGLKKKGYTICVTTSELKKHLYKKS